MNGETAQGYEMYRDALVSAGVNASVARCGWAWETVYNASEPAPLDNTTTFSCLYNNHAADKGAGGVPQCLIDGMGLGGHPSPLGSYLNACVIFAQLFGKSPVGLWAPSILAKADAALVQHVAWAVRQ